MWQKFPLYNSFHKNQTLSFKIFLKWCLTFILSTNSISLLFFVFSMLQSCLFYCELLCSCFLYTNKIHFTFFILFILLSLLNIQIQNSLFYKHYNLNIIPFNILIRKLYMYVYMRMSVIWKKKIVKIKNSILLCYI